MMQISAAVPELPVLNVVEAQQYYATALGFDIAWHNQSGRIGAVNLGDCALFFCEVTDTIHPQTLRFHCPNLRGAHEFLLSRDVNITAPLAKTPWNLWQFTVQDLNGHLLHFHNDED